MDPLLPVILMFSLLALLLLGVLIAAFRQSRRVHRQRYTILKWPLLAFSLLFLAPTGGQAQAPRGPVTLLWEAPLAPEPPKAAPPIDGYHVYRVEVPQTAYQRIGSTATAVRTYADSDRESGKAYSYYITAYNRRGESVPSNIVTDSLFDVPGPPVGASMITIIVQ